jgi:hypothetical protein
MYAGDNSKINSIDMGNELMDSKMNFFAVEYGAGAYWSHPVIQWDSLRGGGPQYKSIIMSCCGGCLEVMFGFA